MAAGTDSGRSRPITRQIPVPTSRWPGRLAPWGLAAVLSAAAVPVPLGLCAQVQGVTATRGHGPAPAAMGALSGRVLDADTGAPLETALVGLEGSGDRALTDMNGRFTLDSVPSGAGHLVVQHLAYGSQRIEVDVPGGLARVVEVYVSPRAIELEPLHVETSGGVDVPERWSRIIGRVVDGEDNLRAVQGATVTLLPLEARALTDDDGRFALAVPPGTYDVEIRHVAFGARRQALRVRPDRTMDMNLRLNPEAVEVAPLTVEVEYRPPALERNGFYRRRARGFGKFLGPAELRAHPAATLEQLVDRMVLGGSRMQRECDLAGRGPAVYLDGRKLLSSRGLPRFSLAEVAALEVYEGPAATPPEFIGGDSRCGVLVIWRKRW